jgi:hypothetical protein
MHQRYFFYPMVFLIIFVSLCGVASHAAPSKHYESPEDFVVKQNIIRACIGNGPNFGDQAATMNVMNRLRQLGFQGTYEVIYDVNSVAKVITLFGLPANLPSVYEDKEKKIKFFELKAHRARLEKELVDFVDLGVSVGKADRICETDNAYTKTFVQFSPYFDIRGSWHDQTSIEIWGQGPDHSLNQIDSGKKYFIFPTTSYSDAKYFLATDPIGKEVLDKKPALSTFLEGMEKLKFNILPVYGRTLRFVSNGNNLVGSPSPSNMLQTIAGARYAQLMGPTELHKPLIIAFFDNYENYASELLAIIKTGNWGAFEHPESEKAKKIIRELGLADAISIASMNDPETIQKINALQPNQILLLSIGSLPKIVFDGLYTHHQSNIWPAVYEGAGSFSMLSLLPIARFECADTSIHFGKDLPESTWTAGFDLIKNPTLKEEMTNFYHSHDGYCGSTYTGYPAPVNFMRAWETLMYQKLGQFIIAANDPQSAFSQYFLELHAAALNPANDRVRYALEDVVKIINNDIKSHSSR